MNHFNHEISTRPDGEYVKVGEEKSFNIYKMTYEETTKFDVGSKPHPRFPLQKKMKVAKPLLSDLIQEVEKYCKEKKLALPKYNIETKSQPETDDVYHPVPQKFVKHLMRVISTRGVADRTIIQSFDPRTLQEVHANYPTIKTALLVDEGNSLACAEQIKALGFKPTIYSPHYSLVNDALISQCKKQHIQIIPWTVNSREKIIELKKAGVDGIITDDPTLFN